MDEDRVAGAAKRLRGSVREAIGKLTGITRTEVEGTVERAADEAKSIASETKDTARNIDQA